MSTDVSEKHIFMSIVEEQGKEETSKTQETKKLPPKRLFISNGLQGAKFQLIKQFITTIGRTSNPTVGSCVRNQPRNSGTASESL
jgi:hypothetical protein